MLHKKREYVEPPKSVINNGKQGIHNHFNTKGDKSKLKSVVGMLELHGTSLIKAGDVYY